MSELSHSWLKKFVDEQWLHYAPDTMRTKIGDIRQFLKWCKKKRHHSKNIAKPIKPARHRKRRHRRAKAAPEADIQRLMQHLAMELKKANLVYRDVFKNLAAAENGWTDEAVRILRDLFIITFFYETGVRAGELSKLGSHTMAEITKAPADTYLITVIGKTNDRDYSFTNRTAELWRIWQQVRPDESRQYAVIGWRRNRDYDRFKTNGISNMILRRCKSLDITPFRAQALRHAKVKRSRRLVGLEVTSILIDHSNINTTRGYANIDEEELAEATLKTGLQFDLWK